MLFQLFKCPVGAAANCVKVTGTTIAVGNEKGALQTWDLRTHSAPRFAVAPTAAPVTSIALMTATSGWAAGADGLCWRWTEGAPVQAFLSGPDCDRLNAVGLRVHNSSVSVYTAARDGLVRQYHIRTP